MTIQLLKDTWVTGAVVSAGTQITMSPPDEAYFVSSHIAVYVGEDPAIQIPNPDQGGETIDGSDFGFKPDDIGVNANGRWAEMLAQAPAYAKVTLPRGKHLITQGAGGNGINGVDLIRKPLVLDFTGARILWQPSVPNSWLLTVSGVGLSFGTNGLNEEAHIFGFLLNNVRVIGNRVNRANAFRFIRCDWVTANSLHVYAIKGTSLKLQKTRECDIRGLRTRYNAYLDPVDFQNTAADVILCSDDDGGTVIGDSTNFCHFADMSLVYALGPILQVDGAGRMSFDQCMVHGLQVGNGAVAFGGGTGASQEDGFIRAVGYGTGGFTGGVANNEYAGLHVSLTGTEASATNLKWVPGMRKCRQITATGGSDLTFNRLTNNGSFADSCIHLSGSTLNLNSSDIHGAESTTTYHTSQVFTADATTDLITMGTATPYLLTMDAVRLTNSGGALPTSTPQIIAYGSSRSANNTYYVRCTNAPVNTTYSLHPTWKDARLNLNIINITTAGTGTHTLLHQHGDVVQMSNNSELHCDVNTEITNARWFVNDDMTSLVFGNYISGTDQSAVDIGRQFGGLEVLAALKRADMTLTTDQQFRPVYGGSFGYITHIIANWAGGGSAAGAIGGLYGGASKSGAAFIPATYNWSKMTGNAITLEWSGRNAIAAATGTVTQITSRSTLVACNGLRGVITTDSTSLAAGADAVFQVNNTSVEAGDNVVVNLVSGSTANTSDFRAINIAAGSFQIRVHNLSAATADTAAAVLNFRVDKNGPVAGAIHNFFVPPSLSLTTGSSVASFVDFYMMGIPANHP